MQGAFYVSPRRQQGSKKRALLLLGKMGNLRPWFHSKQFSAKTFHPGAPPSSPIEGQAGRSQLHCETPHLHHHSWNPTVNSSRQPVGVKNKAKVNFHHGLIPWSGSWLLQWLTEGPVPCSAGEGKSLWRWGEGSRNLIICHCHKMPRTVEPQPEIPTSEKSNLLKRNLTNI